jgi:hypothetical protein
MGIQQIIVVTCHNATMYIPISQKEQKELDYTFMNCYIKSFVCGIQIFQRVSTYAPLSIALFTTIFDL